MSDIARRYLLEWPRERCCDSSGCAHSVQGYQWRTALLVLCADCLTPGDDPDYPGCSSVVGELESPTDSDSVTAVFTFVLDVIAEHERQHHGPDGG